MDLSKPSMGSKWRGIAKKGKRRDVGLLEPTSSSTEERPVPYMPALDKQRGPANLPNPSHLENEPGAADPAHDLKKQSVPVDHSGGAGKNSEPKKNSLSASRKNSIPVPGSNASYGKYGRNSIKVDEKHLTKLKSRKRSFVAAVLGQSEKASSLKSKLHQITQSGGKNLLNNGSTKSNSHKLAVKEKSNTNDDVPSKLDDKFKNKRDHNKSLDHRSEADGESAASGPSEDSESAQLKKPKKKKCGFMRPSRPKEAAKNSAKITQKILDFKPAETLPDIAAFPSEKYVSEKKIQKVNRSSCSSLHGAASKSRLSANKMREEKSHGNDTETRSRESSKTSRKADNIKKFADEYHSRSEERSSEAPVESSRSSSSAKNGSGSAKAPSDHQSDKKSLNFSKGRNREKSEIESTSSDKLGRTFTQVSSEFKCSIKDFPENQLARPTSSVPRKANDKKEGMSCSAENAHKTVDCTYKENQDNQRKGKSTRLSIESNACRDTLNFNKRSNSEAIFSSNDGSKELISPVDKIQKEGEQLRATCSESVTDNNTTIVKNETTLRARSSEPRLYRDRVNERRTRSSVGSTCDLYAETGHRKVKSSTAVRKHGEARRLRSHSLSGKHRVSAHDSACVDVHSKADVGCCVIGSSISTVNVDQVEKDNVKADENAPKNVPVLACEEPSRTEAKVGVNERIDVCNQVEQLPHTVCSSKQRINCIENFCTSAASVSLPLEIKNLNSAQLPKSANVKDASDSSEITAESAKREKFSELTDQKQPVDETKELVTSVSNTEDIADCTHDSKSPNEIKLPSNEIDSSNLDMSRGKKKETGGVVLKGVNVEPSPLTKEKTVSDDGKKLSPPNVAERKPVTDSNSGSRKRVRLDRSSFNKSDKIKEVVEEIIKETSPQKIGEANAPARDSMSPKKKLTISEGKAVEKLSNFSVNCGRETEKTTVLSSSGVGLPSICQLGKSAPLDHNTSTFSEVKPISTPAHHEMSKISSAVEGPFPVRPRDSSLVDNTDPSSSNKSLGESSEKIASTDFPDTCGDATDGDGDNKNNTTENSEQIEKALRNDASDMHVGKDTTVDKLEHVCESVSSSSSTSKPCESDSNGVKPSSSPSICVNNDRLLREAGEQETSCHTEVEQETKVETSSEKIANQDVLEDSPGADLLLDSVDVSTKFESLLPVQESSVSTGTEPSGSDCATIKVKSEMNVSNTDIRKSDVDLNKIGTSAPAPVKVSGPVSTPGDAIQRRNARRSSLRSRRNSANTSTRVAPASSSGDADVVVGSGEANSSGTKGVCISEPSAGGKEGKISSSLDIQPHDNNEFDLPQEESSKESLNKKNRSPSRIEEIVNSENEIEVSEKSMPVDVTEIKTSPVTKPSVSDYTAMISTSSTKNIIEDDRGEMKYNHEVNASNAQKTNDANTTSGVSSCSDAAQVCSIEETLQKPISLKSDSSSSENKDGNKEPALRVLRGRVIEPKKPVGAKTTSTAVSLNSHQIPIKAPESLRVQLKPVVRLISDTTLCAVSKTVKSSQTKKLKGSKPSIPEMKDCLIVPPPPARLPVLVTDDRKAVAMNKRQHRGQLVMVTNVKRHGILDVAYLDDGKVMRYPLRKSKASDTPLLLDSPETEEKELLKGYYKEREKTGANSVKQTALSSHSSGVETSDRKSAVPLITTKHVTSVNKLELTGLHSTASTPDNTSSPRSQSPIVKSSSSKLKEVSNDYRPFCDSEASTSRGSTPLPPNNESDTSQSRSKRQPKASQKLLESFESGSLDLFKNMSKLLPEKPTVEISALKLKEKFEDEISIPKPKDKQFEGQSSAKMTEIDVSAISSETSEPSKSVEISQDSGGSKDIVARKKRPLEEEDGFDVFAKRKKRKEDSDVNTVCCGVDYKSSFDLQRHMVKKAREGDSNHIKKLQSSGYDKCTRCPAWIRASMMAVHLQNIHNESSHASTKLQIQTTVIKLKKQTVLGKNIFKEASANEGFPSSTKKSYTSKKKPFVDLGERISVSESNVNSDENEVIVKKGRRGRKPALKGILSNKQNVPKNKNLNKKSVTLKSPDRQSSTSGSNEESEGDSESCGSSSSEMHSSRRSHSKKKKLKKGACTIDSFDDRDNYKPNAKEGRGLEPLSERSFIDHLENNRAQIKTKLSLRSSRRRPDTISPLLEKSAVAKRKLSSGKSRRKNSFSSSDEQSSESEDASSDSDGDSSSSASEDDKENVPLVELDMFTFPSDDFAIFLMDPKNPKLKVYTSLDTIFVSDVSLGNGKKQVSYLTENNNIIYANHNHPVFPNPSDLQSHIPRPLLVMKMTKLGTSNEKNSVTTVGTNVLKDSNNSSSNRQSSTVSKVTELLSELICKSVKSPRNNKTSKIATIVKPSAPDCARVQPGLSNENITPDVPVNTSAEKQLTLDTGMNLHLSPMKVQSPVLDVSSPILHSTKRSKVLESPSISKGDSLPPTSQEASKVISNHSHEIKNKSLNSAGGFDLLQQVISSTISSPLDLEAYSSQFDSFGDVSVVDPNLSSTVSADEVICCSDANSSESKAPLAPTTEGTSPKKCSDEPLLSGKNIHVIRKSLPHLPNKIVLKASGTSSSKDTLSKSPTKIRVTQQIVQTAPSAASVSAPAASASSDLPHSPPCTANLSSKTSESSRPSMSLSPKTNAPIGSPKVEKSAMPDFKEDVTSSVENNVAQESSKPQKSTWSFLDDDSDEFLATLEFTDTLQSPTCLDGSDGNDSSDSRRKDLISSVKLPEKLPSLVIDDEDFENVFDESSQMFLNPSADEESDPLRSDPPRLGKSSGKLLKQKSPSSNSSLSKRETQSPCDPLPVTPPLESSSRPTFISPPSRKRLQCFDESEGSSPSRTYSKLAYSALSDNDIFGLWPSGASPKVSLEGSPVREVASERHRRKCKDPPLVKHRRLEEKQTGHSPSSDSKSPCLDPVSDERTVVCYESELKDEKSNEVLSSTRVPDDVECDSTNISEKPSFSVRRSSTSFSSSSAACPANNSSRDSLTAEVSNFSPVNLGYQTPKSSNLKLAVSFDDGSVPLEFSLDSIRKRDMPPHQIDALDDSLASGNAGASTNESPRPASPAKRVTLSDRSTPVQFPSDDDRGCISGTESPASQHEMKSKKSGRRKEKKAKSKKRKKEKHRHHSPVRLPSDNKGIRMKINLIGMTSEVMNNEAPRPRQYSPRHEVFSPLIEASKTLDVVHFERPFAGLSPSFAAVDTQSSNSPDSSNNIDHESFSPDRIELIDASQPLTASDIETVGQSDGEPEQDPLLLEDHSVLAAEETPLSVQTNSNENYSDVHRSQRYCREKSDSSGKYSPSRRKRRRSGHSDTNYFSKKFKNLYTEVISSSDGFVSDDASCVSPECLPRDVKPSVESISPTEKVDESTISSIDGENEENIVSPRPWLGRGAKLRAAVLIQDQQEGITDSQVISSERPSVADSVQTPTNVYSPDSKGQLSESRFFKQSSRSPPIVSVRSRRSSTCVSIGKNLNQVSPRHSTPIIRRASADTTTSPEDRTWHSRGAKLKAQVLISDLQSGVENSSVILPITPNPASSDSEPATVYSRSDIRYFFQPKKKFNAESAQSPPSVSSESRPKSDMNSFLLSRNPGAEPSQSSDKKIHDKFSEFDHKSKDQQEIIKRHRPIPSATDVNIPVNNLKCWYESRCSRLAISFGGMPLTTGNFVGFDSLEPYSAARAQTLRHVITLANMKKWSQQSNLYPVPVDQIFDWDEEELVSVLNL